jgi:hypothetical protein
MTQTRSPENSEKHKSDRPKINKHICCITKAYTKNQECERKK